VLLQLDAVGKSFGARRLFGGVTLELRPGDRVALVGPNGAGKTTLMRIAAGLDAADEGSARRGRGARVGLLRQEIDPTSSRSVRAEAGLALAHLDALEAQIRELEREMASTGSAGRPLPAELAARYDRARAAFELAGGFERAARVERVLAGLGFDAVDRDRPLRSFSGGWLMRVELAKLVLSEPDVLLLDEPTNHLDLPSIQWFEATLEGFRGAVLAISHDRAFLRRFATRVAELCDGRFEVYDGGWDAWQSDRAARREQLLAAQRSQSRKIAETERFIERFRYKATKARQVQSRIKALEKLDRIQVEPDRRRGMRLRVPPPERAGEVVVRLEGVHKRYGDTVVYAGADLVVRRGERLALVGPNGAGKSTLLRIVAGVLPFEAGERTLGHNVRVAFYAQHQLEVLQPERSALEELAAVARTEDVPRLRSHLGAFLFSGDDVEKKVAVLSGGEKARLALARMLLRPANFLVLDEPTNHLDVDACEVLERALAAYPGTLVFISHDRAFIDAIATRVVEVRAGSLRDFPGNYADYLRRVGGEAEAPAAPGAVAGHGAPRPAAGAEGRPDTREDRRRSRDRERAREKAARRLSALEADILALESGLEALGWKLGDPEVHRDPERIRSLTAEREATRGAIAALYRDWERLAAEIESLAPDAAPSEPAAEG
jgi:ATP-binding cassette subfamily F protein 3